MNNRFSLAASALLILTSAGLGTAQTPTQQTQTTTTTVTKTVQNADGTYSVIEYPVGKEVKVTLTPVTVPGAKGTATILRDDTGTKIKLNLTGLPSDLRSLNLYAVDQNGAVTSLGPITVAEGTGAFEAATPLNKFMLVAAPEASLTAYNPESVFFRSAVPEGFAVIPHTTDPMGEKVSASTVDASTTAAAYNVPMLNLPAYKTGDDTKMKIKFGGAMTGSRANVFITPRKDGPTEVKLRFHELKDAPAGKVFTAWAVTQDNKFIKLGQVVNTAGRNEAEIRSEVALPDFGLLVTMEDAAGSNMNPMGPNIGVVEIVP